MDKQPEEQKAAAVRLGIRLTDPEKAKLDMIVAARHPGRDRMHSTTIGELIAEEYARLTRAQRKREKE